MVNTPEPIAAFSLESPQRYSYGQQAHSSIEEGSMYWP